ncbi:PREDICTED: dapper homolog 2 [Lipotes vexillifer]|uniref:Dapper homolog 2 n=1 Tax=Lipotes vexillifer TaxID=118797 RepID=A0A340WG39_LIPVE|nr:PREDICTED: dapper homolog 2 [Lipotes vexillifer]
MVRTVEGQGRKSTPNARMHVYMHVPLPSRAVLGVQDHVQRELSLPPGGRRWVHLDLMPKPREDPCFRRPGGLWPGGTSRGEPATREQIEVAPALTAVGQKHRGHVTCRLPHRLPSVPLCNGPSPALCRHRCKMPAAPDLLGHVPGIPASLHIPAPAAPGTRRRSLEFAGSPGLESGLRKEMGFFARVLQRPACTPGGALPTPGGAGRQPGVTARLPGAPERAARVPKGLGLRRRGGPGGGRCDPGACADTASAATDRVGARLRAALAGLHELQGLRARQQARVWGALAVQPPPGPAAPRGPRAHELRLEAALAALQEQLNRLRLQDVGLKTHLDQLDQQISELQLDVRRTSSEAPDSDSRPSSGFYELSDGGSCSLSTSRTSVCSDCVSSSLGAVLPATPKPRPSAGDCRPRSADETTVCGVPLTAWEPQASEGGTGQLLQGEFRPRPVSTGDLERVLPAEVGLQKARAHAKATSFLCHGMDPKYQCDLVSKGGREVYPYPSPLHAVALQSPLFTLTKETVLSDGHSPPSQPLPGATGPSSIRTGLVLEAGPASAYIERLLRLQGRGPPARGSVGERGPPGQEASLSPQGLGVRGADSEGGLEKPVCARGRAEVGGEAQSGAAHGDSLEQPGPVPLVHALHPSSRPEEGPRPPRGCVHWEACPGSPWLGCGQAPTPCLRGQPPALHGWTGRGRSPGRGAGAEGPPRAPGHCVRPHFAARGASPAGPPKAKPVKIKKGASDKVLRLGAPQLQWGALGGPRPPPESGGGLRRPTPARAAPGRSCSESSLYPVPVFIPLLVARPEGHQVSAQALFPLEAAPLVATGGAARRKQRRWRSSVEISARARPDPSLGPHRPVARRGGGPRPVCARPRPGLPRQDARARSGSDGSERPAERAPLFRSTVAEASGDEASRFADGESGGSTSEGGGQGGGSSSRRAPASSRPPLPPLPRLCRVKAPKALKRTRRSRPAALRVMATV